MENFRDQREDPVSKLVFELSKLPGIGEKTATRLAYFILKQDSAYPEALAGAILSAKRKVGLCRTCHTLTDGETCRICSNAQRDLFHMVLIDSALKAGKLPLARMLLSERTGDKPNSRWSWLRFAEALEGSGDAAQAAVARARASMLKAA